MALLGTRMSPVFRTSYLVPVALLFCLTILGLTFPDTAAEAESTAAAPVADTAWRVSASHSNRLIVEFDSPALAELYAQDRLVTHALESLHIMDSALQTYAVQLENEQQMFQELLHQTMPGVTMGDWMDMTGHHIPLTFAVVKNAAVLEAPGELTPMIQTRIASLPNVRNVYLDFEVFPQLYAGPALTNLDSLWSQPTFERSQSGQGIRIASIDAGLHKEAPMFSGTNFRYPSGYPADGLGLTKANNGKIIVSRTYFRATSPPVTSDHFAWPGSGSSHGVHTAAIAAGNIVTSASFRGTPLPTLSGVAPGAWLGNYRVFYRSRSGKSTFFTAEGVAALEDSIQDGMDIVIGSWGSGPSVTLPPHNFLDAALVNTVHAGVSVVMAAGNYGPLPFSVANPAPEYLTVGAVSTSGRFAMGQLEVHTPTRSQAMVLSDQQYAASTLGPHFAAGTSHRFPLADAQTLNPANPLGCDPWPDHALNGQILLVQRGSCTFRHKVEQAQRAGASAVLVFNHAAGGQSLIKMASDSKGGPIRIPSLFIGHQAGVMLSQLMTLHADVTINISTQAHQVGNQPLVIPAYSGRGPTALGTLKPDLVAPGDHILSQGYGPSGLDTSRHLTYGQSSGTSMATPFVAGAVALVKEKYPDWTHDMVSSALMNTARYQGIYNHDGSIAEPTDMGAGLVDLTAALATQLLVAPPRIDFGRLRQPSPTGFTHDVSLTNVSESPARYDLSLVRLTHTGTEPLPGVSVDPTTVTLAAGATTTVTLSLQPGAAPVPSFLQGHLVLQGQDTAYQAPVFAWLDLPPAPQSILLIDADLSPRYPDYAAWYRQALDDLKLAYNYWDTSQHEQKIPAWINTGSAPDVILLFTGDHWPTRASKGMPEAFTALDWRRLEQYVRAGGHLWMMGKNSDRVLEGSTALRQYILGSAQIQRQTADRLGHAQLHLTAAPTAPTLWQEMDLDVGAHELDLGTVNLLTGVNTQTWGWTGQMLSGDVAYVLSNFQQHLRYRIHLQGSGQFEIVSAQFLVREDGGTLTPVQDLLDASTPLAVNRSFRWNGVLHLTDTVRQARLDGNLMLRLVLQGDPPVTLETYVPTRAVTSNNAAGALPLHAIQGTTQIAQLAPILGALPTPNDTFRVVGISRQPDPASTAGSVLFTTFGLEHVNDATTTTSRSQLLRTALMYLAPDLDIPLPADTAQ